MNTSTVLQGTLVSLLLILVACERTEGPTQTEPAPQEQESSASNTSDTASSSNQEQQDEQPIRSLSSSADRLVNDFNAISGKKKLVMILSPTWPRCAQGIRAIQEELVANVRPSDIEIFAVWTRGISRDNRQEAVKMTQELQGSNIHHYWDQGQVVPTAFSKQFNWTDTLAWDIYLFYGPGTEWTSVNAPPEPELWFHQRSGVNAHTDKLVTPAKIRQILREMVTSPEK